MRGKEGIDPCGLQQQVLTARLGAIGKVNKTCHILFLIFQQSPLGSGIGGTGGGERSRTQGSQGELVFVHCPTPGRGGHALTEVLWGGISALAAPPIEMTCVSPP